MNPSGRWRYLRSSHCCARAPRWSDWAPNRRPMTRPPHGGRTRPARTGERNGSVERAGGFSQKGAQDFPDGVRDDGVALGVGMDPISLIQGDAATDIFEEKRQKNSMIFLRDR